MNLVYNDRENIILYQGDALQIKVTVEDESGAPVDISGASIKWAVGKEAGSTADFVLEDGNGITINNSEEFTISISGSDTAALDGAYYPDLKSADTDRMTNQALRSSYYHECQIVNSAGDPHVVFSGRLFVRTSLVESQP